MTHVDGFCRHARFDPIDSGETPQYATPCIFWEDLSREAPETVAKQFNAFSNFNPIPVPDGKYVDHGRDRKTKLSESTTTATALGIGSGCHKSLDAGMNRKLKHSNHLMCI